MASNMQGGWDDEAKELHAGHCEKALPPLLSTPGPPGIPFIVVLEKLILIVNHPQDGPG